MSSIIGVWGRPRVLRRDLRSVFRTLSHRGSADIVIRNFDAGRIGHGLQIFERAISLRRPTGFVAGGLAGGKAAVTRLDFAELGGVLGGPSSEREALFGRRFAIAAAIGDELILARDPLGAEPLYWSRKGSEVSFASEVKGLLPLDDDAAIEVFPAGMMYSTKHGLRALTRARQAPPSADDSASKPDLAAAIEAAVRRETSGLTRVGVFLSGGIDSALIAALAKRSGVEVVTFVAGFPGSPDLASAAAVAAALGCEHNEVVLQMDRILRDLPISIHQLESFDPTLVECALPMNELAHFAARRVDVVLTGDGADELFGGYEHMQGLALHRPRFDDERRALLADMERFNLQRLDRMVSAHAIDVRTPYLDPEVVEAAFALEPRELFDDGPGKAPLRRIAATLIGAEAARRDKAMISIGSGMNERLALAIPENRPAVYRRIFETFYPRAIADLIRLWKPQGALSA